MKKAVVIGLETDQVQGIAEDIRRANYIRKILK